jgi:hypothetical protein
MTTTHSPGYSAAVKIQLLVDGEVLGVSRLGPDSLSLHEPRQVSPQNAIIVVNVDGREHRHPVVLDSNDGGSVVHFW